MRLLYCEFPLYSMDYEADDAGQPWQEYAHYPLPPVLASEVRLQRAESSEFLKSSLCLDQEFVDAPRLSASQHVSFSYMRPGVETHRSDYSSVLQGECFVCSHHWARSTLNGRESPSCDDDCLSCFTKTSSEGLQAMNVYGRPCTKETSKAEMMCPISSQGSY
jgi:hypothetical protein